MNFLLETEKLCHALQRRNNLTHDDWTRKDDNVDLIGSSRTVPNIDQSKCEWAGLETGVFHLGFCGGRGRVCVMRALFSVAAGNTQSCQGR